VIHDGSDDTFPLGAGYAELYTLAVLSESRGAGIGTMLLDALDAELAGREVPHLTVAVMTDNEAAIRCTAGEDCGPARSSCTGSARAPAA